MPLPRFQRLDENKRRQLLQTATREFAAKGFDAASLNEILSASGLGKSSYYYYFEDKEDLYATCLLDALSRMFKEMPPFDVNALTARTFWTAIETYFQKMISLGKTHPDETALFRDIPMMRARLAPEFQKIAHDMTAPVIDVIRRGQALGCVRKDLEAPVLFAIGIAADNALDESFFARGTSIGAPELSAHGAVVLDTWHRLLGPTPQRKPSR